MKDQILRVLSDLPDDASIEDAMERLYLYYKIERGLAQANAGKTVTQAEARARLASIEARLAELG